MARIEYTKFEGHPLLTALSFISSAWMGLNIFFIFMALFFWEDGFLGVLKNIGIGLLWLIPPILYVAFGQPLLIAYVYKKDQMKKQGIHPVQDKNVVNEPTRKQPEQPYNYDEIKRTAQADTKVKYGITDNDVAEIKKWKNLYDTGIITEAEFQDKKKQILGL